MPIRSVCIVGGGTAGWMTATALAKNIPDLVITIIEPDSIGTIGVGEATVPSVKDFILYTLGFNEQEWMASCNATYKTSLKFNNFTSVDKDDSYFHTFTPTPIKIIDWRALSLGKQKLRAYDEYNLMAEVSRQNKFDLGSTEGAYSYNLDASKFSSYCKSKCLEVGVTLVTDAVDKVMAEDGLIEKLVLITGEIIDADMFIDCTGFASILHKQALGSDFVSFSEFLPNNNAFATRISRDCNSEIDNYTTCQALGNGWSWNVPLYDRDGVGYVYSDKFITKADALAEFKTYLKGKYGVDVDSLDIAHIPFGDSVGYTPTPWTGNCVAIGMSFSFIEPLESTALWATTNQITSLVSAIQSNSTGAVYRELFNEEMTTMIKKFRDFIVLHYSSGKREDTAYWKDLKNNIKIPIEVIEKIRNLETPNPEMGKATTLFGDDSWTTVALGQQIINPKDKHLITFNNLDAYSDEALKNIKRYAKKFNTEIEALYLKNKRVVNSMSTHREYLDEYIYRK